MAEIEPLLFLHGLFGPLSDDVLLSRYDDLPVFAPNLLGYGEYCTHDISSISLIDQAEHVRIYMDKNSKDRVNLAGHSVGGAVAALLAIHHPDRVRLLVSVEGNMTPPDAFWSASLAQKSVNEIQKMVDSYLSDVAA